MTRKSSIVIEIKKPILKKFRNSFELLLFSIILLKIVFFYKKEKKNEGNKNDLYFRIVNEKNERIKRFISVNYRYSLF